MKRSVPTNLQAEPPYPDHETVCFCMSAPDWTCHFITERCSKDWPHLIKDCGEFELSLPEVPKQ